MMKRFIVISFLTIAQFFLLNTTALLHAQDDKPYRLDPISDDAYQAILQFYQYDKEMPLEVNVVSRQERKEYIREKIVFNGIRNSRVPGYLAIPTKGNPPFPCILQMHGLTLSKLDWWENSYDFGDIITKKLLNLGYAVLALDMQYHGERIKNNEYEPFNITLFNKKLGYRFRDMIVQSVIEYRRAMDYLETRSEIDFTRFGVIGYSIGGVMTFILTGIDSRIDVSVACVTPTMKPRSFLPQEQYISGYAAHTFVRNIKDRPFFMLMGNNDQFNYTVEEAKQLYDLIPSNQKNIIFYESGHKMPEDYVDKSVDWFVKYLK